MTDDTMKYKDKVILVFLLAVLLYAVCYRNNILPFGNNSSDMKGENVTTTQQDSLIEKATEIHMQRTGEEGTLSGERI